MPIFGNVLHVSPRETTSELHVWEPAPDGRSLSRSAVQPTSEVSSYQTSCFRWVECPFLFSGMFARFYLGKRDQNCTFASQLRPPELPPVRPFDRSNPRPTVSVDGTGRSC